MKKRILAALLAALLLMTAGVALAATSARTDEGYISYDVPYIGKTAESNVVLRASAYSRGQIVDTLRKGVKLTVTAAKYDTDGVLWYEAETTSRKTGWVMASQVAFDGEDSSSTSSYGSSSYGSLLGSLLGGYGSYVGNVNTHVYHLPTCRVLPKPENQTYFDTKAQAEREGYRACGICKP